MEDNFIKACQLGDIDLILSILKEYNNNINIIKNILKNINYTLLYSNIDYDSFIIIQDLTVYINYDNLCKYAYKNGYKKLLKNILTNYDNIDIHFNNDELLKYVIDKGYLDVLKIILKKYININIYNYDNYAFIKSSYYGHLDVLKYLLENYFIDDIVIEKCFINACASGYIEIVEYLLEKYPNINVQANNKEASRFAYSNGYSNIVELLKKYI